MSTHVIEKQFLEVTFTDRRGGMGLQDQLATLYKEKVLPLFETVMNEEDVKDYTIQIDAITIDAGRLTAANWEQELVKRSVQQFKAILQQKLLSPLPQKHMTKDNTGAGNTTPRQTAALSPDPTVRRKDQLKQEGVQWIPEAQHQYRRFWQFLTTGSLEVHDNRQTLEGLMTALLQHSSSWQKAGNREEWIQQLLTSRPALERLIRQCGPWLEELLGWLYERPVSTAPFYEKIMREKTGFNRRLLLSTLTLLHIAKRTRGIAAAASAPAQLLQELFPPAANPNLLVYREASEAKDGLSPTENTAAGMTEKQTTATGEPFHIYNAGLIILHPFLLAFFEKGELTGRDKKWVSPEAQQRAVLLTQYLVTGETVMPEFYLPLNKLLCGYPLQAPVDCELEITEREQAEVNALLASVIEHWGALKNTSATTLRHTFLQRAGKLTQNGQGWHLVAEQKTVDILMQSIPWAISRIKTPWMQEWLLTDWT